MAGDTQAPLPLSQPGVSGTGSSRVFSNPWPEWQEPTFSQFAKFFWARRSHNTATGHLLDHPNPTPADLARAFPLALPNYTALATPAKDAVQVTWLGHASCLVQMDGVNFLTDPVFSQRCSPVQWKGPRRIVQPPFKLDDPQLPHIHFVVISHNHYDHLDYNSVLQLHKRFGDDLTWYVPLGLAAWFRGVGISNVHELGWWQELRHGDSSVTLACTPAQHASSRTGFTDKNKSLWCGWAVLGKAQRFWFAGDTGYCGTFKEIGQQYGPFDLCAIPIASYTPRWFLKSIHVNPADAVQIHQDVKSKRSIGIHCCTMTISMEPLDEAPKVLEVEKHAAAIPKDAFITLQHGAMLQTANGTDLNKPSLMIIHGSS
ncbi:hypothetical protein ABBQ38_007077 [Trebouxia sp. C0009 RCD-2024]